MIIYPIISLSFSFIAELAIFIYFSYNTLERKYAFYKIIITSSVGYLFMLICSLFDNGIVNTVLFIFINLIILKAMFLVSLRKALFYTFVLTIVMALSEFVPLIILRRFTYDYYNDSFVFYNRILYSIISKSLYFIIIYLLIFPLRKRHFESIQTNKIPAIYYIVPILSLCIIIPLMFLWSQDFSYIRDLPIKVLIPIITVLIAILNILIYIDEYHRKKSDHELTEIQLIVQRDNDMKQYYQQIIQASEDRAVLIHDIKKHLMAIQAINSLNENIDITKYIQNILNMPILKQKRIHSDNDFLNMILDGYSDRCKNESISFNTDIRSHSVDFLSTDDITTLFCNLLDNAMDAARNIDNGFIDLSVDRHADSSISIIRILNSCKVCPIDKNGILIQTTKPDRIHHGYGMKSIKKIIDKYGGILDYSYEDCTFRINIVLKYQKNGF